jgi:hypothetical protein
MEQLEQSPIVCFLDESATDAKDSDQAVLWGIVLNRKDLSEFDSLWNAMLARHGAKSGIHMIELGPNGPYPHLIGDACIALLSEAVGLINHFRNPRCPRAAKGALRRPLCGFALAKGSSHEAVGVICSRRSWTSEVGGLGRTKTQWRPPPREATLGPSAMA